jgi:glycosyltransferase involved in cell wall biosynthesis/peptidoglycan/xylan/chitin deacetylase (PgdA/CDA1 family)
MGMEKIRILYMLDTLIEKAGSERNLFDIVTNLNRERFEPIVVCMRGGSMVVQLRERGIEVMDIGLRRIYTPAALRKAFALYRFIRRRGISIMVTYHESSDYLGSVLGRVAGVPVIISSRRDMGYRLERRHIVLYRIVNRLFDRIVTVSEAVKDIIARREHVPWRKLVRIYNGVDVGLFHRQSGGAALRASLGLVPGRPVVGILAVLRPIKGHRCFFEAADRVRRRFPDACFLAVGWPVGEEYPSELREQVRRLGLENNVIFTGGRRDTPAVLSLFDVAVFASLNEGFSNAVIEAMAAGKPIVATRNGGTAEALVDGESGVLVDPQDPDGLAQAVIGVLEDRDRARELGANAERRVREMFTLPGMIRETEDLYETLLMEKRHGIARQFNRRTVVRAAMRSAKHAAAAMLYYLGIMRAMRRMFATRNGVKILAYHRISDDRFLLPGMAVRRKNFERQMRYIARYFSPLSLSAAVDLIERREKLPDNAVVVTFDDGYRDNYVNAFPVLQRYNIPATIFLSARAIDEGSRLWFDTVLEAFRATRRQSVALDDHGLGTLFLSSSRARLDAAQRVVSYAKRFRLAERTRFVGDVLERLKVSADDMRGPRLMMSWDDVQAMHRAGISFGSHGLNHVILSQLPRRELIQEIAGAKELIRKKAGIDTAHFAYPNGGASDFNREIERLLHRYDYVTACTLIRGNNDCTENRLSLRRICVTEGMESNAVGSFSRSLFAIMLAGM